MSQARVRRLGNDEWARLREIRLLALRDAPDAFETTAEEAERLAESDWRERLEGRAAFVAEAGGALVGLVSGIPSHHAGQAEVISMWVQAEWRGQGAGDELVEAVIAWAIAEGFTGLRLWVTDGNERAERLYARHGFTRTGEQQPVRKTARMEFAMARPVRLPEAEPG